jgi:hypothetical protein
LAILVEEGRARNEKITAEVLLVNLHGMRAAIGHGLLLWTIAGRRFRTVDIPVARQADALFGSHAQPFGQGTIGMHDSMLGVDDGNQVGNSVEGPFPLLSGEIQLPVSCAAPMRPLCLLVPRILNHDGVSLFIDNPLPVGCGSYPARAMSPAYSLGNGEALFREFPDIHWTSAPVFS